MAGIPPRPELLEAADSRGRPTRWMWSVVLLSALVVAAAAWAADAHQRAREASAVVACEQGLRQASWHSERRMGLLAHYVQPATRTTEGVQQLHLADLMARPAHRVLPDVQRADRICRAVSVEPWHFSLASRRNASTAYSGALVTLLQAVAAQGRAYFHDEATLMDLRHAAGIEGPGPG